MDRGIAPPSQKLPAGEQVVMGRTELQRRRGQVAERGASLERAGGPHVILLLLGSERGGHGGGLLGARKAERGDVGAAGAAGDGNRIGVVVEREHAAQHVGVAGRASVARRRRRRGRRVGRETRRLVQRGGARAGNEPRGVLGVERDGRTGHRSDGGGHVPVRKSLHVLEGRRARERDLEVLLASGHSDSGGWSEREHYGRCRLCSCYYGRLRSVVAGRGLVTLATASAGAATCGRLLQHDNGRWRCRIMTLMLNRTLARARVRLGLGLLLGLWRLHGLGSGLMTTSERLVARTALGRLAGAGGGRGRCRQRCRRCRRGPGLAATMLRRWDERVSERFGRRRDHRTVPRCLGRQRLLDQLLRLRQRQQTAGAGCVDREESGRRRVPSVVVQEGRLGTRHHRVMGVLFL
ncbi:hypothetical protein EXIGLDRAFT_328140 [Exidia glandulosa HHB12029]|uniref:Uncharacterized protein n=1 Tax=Exidia glandulosa HHB12029 TaxID=1314781 RepID=A0A165LPG6_EXIGL|nr:hypothetical protein EXIGLDRAFT_328140 [Exidia glandulosa HHB12029]